jgi:hypothetical protein
MYILGTHRAGARHRARLTGPPAGITGEGSGLASLLTTHENRPGSYRLTVALWWRLVVLLALKRDAAAETG